MSKTICFDDIGYKDFFDEIKKVADKHGVTAVAICGTGEGNTFVGKLCVESENVYDDNVMSSILNVARLWQYARETTRLLLDEYEGKWK